MDRRFADKVALVSGGASGIGAAITARLVAEGARVVVGDIQEAALPAILERHGAQARVVHIDATLEEDAQRLVAEAIAAFGRLDCAFHAAGGQRPARFTEVSDKHWDATIRLNMYSAFYGTQHAARQFLQQASPGSIVNIASLNASLPMHGGVGYASAKAGTVMISRQAALELGEHSIRVNSVSPGMVHTPLTAPVLETPEMRDLYLERIPFRRSAQPEEIAAAALFLASDDASYITGHDLVVDGGWSQTGNPDLRPFFTSAP
ncbi:SDR family oxidoreductase [Streptomyces sp. NPDC002896]|uniref:SDR family NAD(P)-dependent oxidoreductase n=1 Tax=Streptomyces sp. NPDC002896 TaxID=3154438 RepID=UPI003319B687